MQLNEIDRKKKRQKRVSKMKGKKNIQKRDKIRQNEWKEKGDKRMLR